MFFCLVNNVFKANELGLDIALIALPTKIALAADLLSSLMDTTFFGQIGNPFSFQAFMWVMLSVINLDIRGSFAPCTILLVTLQSSRTSITGKDNKDCFTNFAGYWTKQSIKLFIDSALLNFFYLFYFP